MPEELDGDRWMRQLLSGELKVRPARGWRACRVRMLRYPWYRWLEAKVEHLRVRVAPVPMPKPRNVEIPMMGFRICLWEPCSYASTWIKIPDTDINLLMHPTCNRVVGIQIWE